MHGSYMANYYDFYKPAMGSEYPSVDGPLTIETYIKALDGSYQSYKIKLQALLGDKAPKSIDLTSFDYALLHCPYCKLVSKGFARMVHTRLYDFAPAPQTNGILSLTPGVQRLLRQPPIAGLLGTHHRRGRPDKERGSAWSRSFSIVRFEASREDVHQPNTFKATKRLG